MRIVIDIRSLIEPFPSGVSEYTKQIVKNLLRIDKENEYLLFCNSAKGLPSSYYQEFQQTNSKIIVRRLPNKLFNTSLFLLNYPKLDRITRGVDIFFLPNLNFSTVSAKSKLIVTVHDISFKYPKFYSVKSYLWHFFIRPKKILERADKIITVSESTKNDLQRVFNIPADKIQVIYLGVDIQHLQNIEKDKIEQFKCRYHLKSPFVLYFGNVEKRKNIEGLLAAWQIFHNRYHSDCQLVVAGKVMDKHLPNKFPNVQFLGYLPEEEKPYLYRLALAFVYPSYYEGFGLPVLEAMAGGLPVITSHSTSLPEVAGESALLVNPYNVEEIAEAIYQMVTNEKLRQHLIEKARVFSQRFSWQKTAEKTLSLFRSILN